MALCRHRRPPGPARPAAGLGSWRHNWILIPVTLGAGNNGGGGKIGAGREGRIERGRGVIHTHTRREGGWAGCWRGSGWSARGGG